MEQQELSILKDFERDSKWFHENINKLREEGFTEKFVAIKNVKPLTSGENMKNVVDNVIEKGENPSYIFIGFVYPEGYTLIL